MYLLCYIYILFGVICIFIYDKDFFYRLLRIDPNDLEVVLIDKSEFYKLHTIPKKGNDRVIHAITKDCSLYKLQKNLLNNFLSNIPVSDSAFGFIKGLSYKDYLEPHVFAKNLKKDGDSKNKYFLRIDLKDFFTCFNKELMEKVIGDYIKINNEKERKQVIDFITEIVTLNDKLPQGAVTSPAISNICFRRFDQRIEKYCSRLDVVYTRYADDLLFSSYNDKLHKPFFRHMVKKILKGSFTINGSKTKQTTGEISINGFIVGDNIRLSRKRLSDLNSIFFLYSKDGNKPKSSKELVERVNEGNYIYRTKEIDCNNKARFFTNKNSVLNYLSGYRSFLINWIPENQYDKSYKRIKFIIEQIEQLIGEIIIL